MTDISKKIESGIVVSKKRNSKTGSKAVSDIPGNYQNDLFFQLSSLPFFILAADGAFLSVNKAGEDFLQLSVNELRLLNIKNFISDSKKHLIDNLISKALLENKYSIEDSLVVCEKEIPVRITASIIPQTLNCVFEIVDLEGQYNFKNFKKIEESYRTLIDEAGVGIFIADINGNYTSVNKFGCDMLGYTHDELIKLNIRDVLVPEEIKEVPIKMQTLLQGYRTSTERNMVRKDGTLVPVEISGKILSDGRLQGIVHNLTKRKRAEKALKTSEANYKHAESIAHIGSWQMDLKTGKSKWSDEFFRICGYEPQSFEPTRTLRFQVVHPEDRELSERAIKKAISEKSSYKVEKRVLRPNGEVRFVLSVGEIIVDNNNEPKEIKGVFLDITDLKISELSLKKSEEKYRKLLEFLPIGIVIRNQKGELIYYNHKATELLNKNILTAPLEHARIIRKDETEMGYGEFPSTQALGDMRIIENAEVGVVTENRTIWVNTTAAPMPTNEEVIVAFTDITEKIEREKQLNELSQKLRELNATKDKFFSIIAHDLKNPFNSILGFSELLLKHIANYTPAEIEKFVGIINDTSQKTYNLLENLLLWSRSQTGTIEFNPEIYSLSNLVKENVEFIEPMALKKHIRIIYEAAGELNIQADKNMMDTVMRNLLTNAVKFSYPESEIEIRAFEKDGSYVFSVKDTGIGIAPENLGKLFRLDSKFSVLGTNKEKGSGLGLLISKEFVEKNRGKIFVTSEPGKGTEFRVLLPAPAL